MIIVMRRDATEKQIQAVIDHLVSMDFDVHRSTGEERTVLGAVGAHVLQVETAEFESLEGVKEVIRITRGDE